MYSVLKLYNLRFLSPSPSSQAVISDCVQLMAARAKAANVNIFLDVVGEVRQQQQPPPPKYTKTYRCSEMGCTATITEADLHFCVTCVVKTVPFSHILPPPPPLSPQSQATQVYKVNYSDTTQPPQTLVAMVTSFNHLNEAIQNLLLNGETLATEVCSGSSSFHDIRLSLLTAEEGIQGLLWSPWRPEDTPPRDRG